MPDGRTARTARGPVVGSRAFGPDGPIVTDPNLARPSRRTVLRWGAAAGAVGLVPSLLTACDPVAPLVGPPKPDPSLTGIGFSGGIESELHQGGWCWFQQPRATIDTADRLWIGSSYGGTFTAQDGDVAITAVDLADLHVIERTVVAHTQQDDHTSPAVMAMGSDVFAAWSLHKRVDYLETARHHPGAAFAIQRLHRPNSLKDPGRGMSYAQLHLIGKELWLLYRGEQFSWNLLTSTDGKAWTARGLVVAPPVSGQRPYLRSATDGKVLHIIVTDGNPAEFRGNGAYAGSIGADLRVRDTTGRIVGTVGKTPPVPSRLTTLLPGIAGADEAGDTDRWLADLTFVANRPTGILITRDPWPAAQQEVVEQIAEANDEPVGQYRHTYSWVRGGPSGWRVEPMAKGGSELRPGHPDYTGLAAQDPTNLARTVVSTNVHPATGAPLVSTADSMVHFELFEGIRTSTGPGGAGPGLWTWTALTQNSVEDNIRPVIAAGGTRKVLCWLRGHYWSWTAFDTRVVVRRVS